MKIENLKLQIQKLVRFLRRDRRRDAEFQRAWLIGRADGFDAGYRLGKGNYIDDSRGNIAVAETEMKERFMVCLILHNKRGAEERYAGEFEAVKKCQEEWIRTLRWASLHPDSSVCKQIRDRADSVTLCWSITGEEQPLSEESWPTRRLLRPGEWLSPDGTIASNAQGNPRERSI